MAGGSSVDKVAVSRQEAGEWVGRLCKAVREAVGAERVIAWLYDAPRQVVIPYAVDSPGAIDDLVGDWAEIPLDQIPVAVSVVLEARPTEIADAQADDRIPPDLAAELAMGSARFEPLLAGRAVGMLSIEPAAAGASPELHTLLPLVAAAVSRVSGAIESDRQRTEAEFLLGLTEAALAAGTLDEMLSTLCERVAALVGARRATVLLVEDGRMVAGGVAVRGRLPGSLRMGADAQRPLGAAGRRGSVALGRAGRHRHVEVSPGRGLVGRHPRNRVADRGRDRQPTPRGRRAARRRCPARQLLRRGGAARGRRGGAHRARDRAGADERRAHIAPARRDRDPPAAPGGVAWPSRSSRPEKHSRR